MRRRRTSSTTSAGAARSAASRCGASPPPPGPACKSSCARWRARSAPPAAYPRTRPPLPRSGMADQLPHKRALLPRVRRVVIKIGSSILSGPHGIDRERIVRLVAEIAALRAHPYQIVQVSSGAVAAGMTRLGLRERPKTVPARQAAAAVGQIRLMALYDEHFAARGQPVAQILLTHD